MMDERPTLGELFGGIGGFGLGFERAGWRTCWQVEWNAINRAVLADRFPDALQLRDVRSRSRIRRVDAIAFGSPCTNISVMANGTRGGKGGLDGPASSLFWEAIRVIDELRPSWVVFENVPALINSNAGSDLERIIGAFAERNYLGFARVLDAQHFGVPQRRRRLFLVCGAGRYPSHEFMADAAPMGAVPRSPLPGEDGPGDSWAGYTLCAGQGKAKSRISLSSELLVAEAHGWSAMAERARAAEVHGFSAGLDEANSAEAFAAGNAVCPAIAEWIARILLKS